MFLQIVSHMWIRLRIRLWIRLWIRCWRALGCLNTSGRLVWFISTYSRRNPTTRAMRNGENSQNGTTTTMLAQDLRIPWQYVANLTSTLLSTTEHGMNDAEDLAWKTYLKCSNCGHTVGSVRNDKCTVRPGCSSSSVVIVVVVGSR